MTKQRGKPAKMGDSIGQLQALIERAGAEKGRIPPVERWNPDICGDIDIEIRADGTWFYQNSPIHRERLVRLFSTVLRKDADGMTYLVTPVEKLRIRVEDAPFLAVEMHCQQRDGKSAITFRTNVGDIVEAGPLHPIRFELETENQGVKPYVRVRGRLEALATRPVMHELIGHGKEVEVDGNAVFAVVSNDAVFPLMPVDELARRVESG